MAYVMRGLKSPYKVCDSQKVSQKQHALLNYDKLWKKILASILYRSVVFLYYCNETEFSARAVYVHELVKTVILRRVRVVKSCARHK